MKRSCFALVTIIIAIAAVGSTSPFSAARAQGVSTATYVVAICTSEAGNPWALKNQGTMTRSKSTYEVIYMLDVKDQGYTWRFVTNPDRSTTIMGPGLLIGKLVERPTQPDQPLKSPRGPINMADSGPDSGPRGQSLDVNGEIREHAGSFVLSVAAGRKCPASPSTIERRSPTAK
jgi:hypothetical protein